VSHRCLTPEELEGARNLAPGDARRREIEECPRCRALLESYVEFLDDRSVPEGIDVAAASERLSGLFEAEVGDDSPAPPLRAPHRGVALPPRTARSWTAWLSGARVGWAVAAALVVAIGLYWGRALAPMGGEDALRSGPDSTGTAVVRPGSLETRIVDVGIELRWTSVPDADAYRVILLGDDLSQIAALGPLADTVLVVEAARLPAGVASGATVGWQVEALRGGFAIGTSETAVAKLP
jgi:hypothetical protein